ncbi:MAG: hypothetical protein NWQ09_09135 [Nonlabens sp.]|nr:hypothetical protein [Nonlabens sp.]
MRAFIFFFSILTSVLTVSAQNVEIEGIYSFYTKADSVKNLDKPFLITPDFKVALSKLEKQHPSKFFEKSGDYFQSFEFDNSAFLYHLGILRYSYYNLTNEDYEASGDGALFSSLKFMVGEAISIYLKNDIEKYIEILQAVDTYNLSNDYVFHSKNIYTNEFNNLLFNELINDLSSNKTEYSTDWLLERNKMKEQLKSMLESDKENRKKQ